MFLSIGHIHNFVNFGQCLMFLTDTCKMLSRSLLLYNWLMTRSACGKIFLWRRANDSPVRMLKTSLLVVLTYQRHSYSQTLIMLGGMKNTRVYVKHFFLTFSWTSLWRLIIIIGFSFFWFGSAFYKNMVKVAKCVTYNKVLFEFFSLWLEEPLLSCLSNYIPFWWYLGSWHIWVHGRGSYWKS